ncbi:MAG: histidine phosphatase family protein [Gammaproteobacteria bacterium]|nr:histidine phosphatase family protein [Gammaproteobacteria bacterium]
MNKVDMLEIVVMRHGEPRLPQFNRIKAGDFQACVKIYDEAGICESSRPHESILSRFKGHDTVVSSDLNRSQQSAALFSDPATIRVDPLFREAQLPYVEVPIIRLHPFIWGYIFHLFWLARFPAHTESRGSAKKRSGECARRLIELAHKNGKVMLVGHGLINACIGSELRALGWAGPRIPGTGFWDYSIYRKTVASLA